MLPSKNYNIDDYPTIKEYLLNNFGMEKLEQTGKTYIKDGKIIKSRKKTNNKWYETQDSISYWNDFNKQKIIYPETTQGAYFVLDNDSFFIDKTCFIMTGNKLKFLQSVLSSQLFEFAYKRIFSSIELGKKGYQYNKFSIVKLPIIEPSIEMEIEMNALNDNYIKTGDSIYLKKIDSVLYNCYNITNDEIRYINENK